MIKQNKCLAHCYRNVRYNVCHYVMFSNNYFVLDLIKNYKSVNS